MKLNMGTSAFQFIFSILLFSGFNFYMRSQVSETTINNKKLKVFALKSPNNLDFCGEKVPINFSDIQERLDRELLVNTYWQSNMMLLIKRANKWFPKIEEILNEEGRF